jgi:hypothetical protein
MSKKEQIIQINKEAAQKKLKLNFKLRNLVKDPLQFAKANISNGAIYVEYVEDADFPYGGFAVISLGALVPLPNSTPDDREIEQLFINFGFHKTKKELVGQIHSTLSSLYNGISATGIK